MPDLPDVGEAVEDVTGGLTRKVGPLPVWGWAVIVVGGVTAAVVIRRRLSGSGPESDAGDDGDELDPLDNVLGFPSLPGRVPAPGGDGTDPGTTGPVAPAPTTNGEWQVAAIRYLIGKGFQPTIVTDAIGRYMLGRVLTAQAQAVVDAALAGIGPPPQPVPPPTVSPTPEPDPSDNGGGEPRPPRRGGAPIGGGGTPGAGGVRT